MFRILLFTFVAAALAAPQTNKNLEAAPACTDEVCKAPDCRCSSTTPPGGLEITQVPQFVFFTFDDAIQQLNHAIYAELFYNRTNPDGCPVSATFFMSHDYTDYSKVNDLYAHGHEIAVHSITHDAHTEYWKNISVELATHEFGDEKTLIAHFANIPEDAIKGMRVPFLQLAGQTTFQVGKDIGLLYDCSWPTQTFRNPGLWPYTLDYKSTQDCEIGPCPKESVPGMWVVPMIDWVDQGNIVCSMVDACVNIPDNADDLAQWFIDNFNVQYNNNRAPFGFYVHAAYFAVNPIHQVAYAKFLDYLQTLNDVYLVTPTRAIEWIQNPVAIGSAEWPECPVIDDTYTCPNPAPVCNVKKGEEDRYMTVCTTECPAVYPWLNNPLGEDVKK